MIFLVNISTNLKKRGRGEARSGFEKSLIQIGKEVKGLCDEETEAVDLEDWKSLKEEVEKMVD